MAENLKDQVAPKSPPGAPEHVQHLLSKLSESLNLDAPRTAFLALRENLIYLLELFTGIAAACATELKVLDAKSAALWKKDASLTDVENLLASSLTALEPQRSNPAVANLRSVFFVGDTTSKPSPRRHSRLLRIAGAPFRGYVFLSEFAELKPSSRDAFAAEVKRYLPILKEWLAAAQPFFKDLKVVEEGVTSAGLQQVTVELGTLKLDLGQAIRVQECTLCPAAAAREPAKAAAAKPAAAGATTKSGVTKTAATAAKSAAAAGKKPEEAGAATVKGPVVKKVLVVKRPDGTIVRKVVQTVSASDVAKAKPPEAAKTGEGVPSPRPELISPQDAPDGKAKVPVKTPTGVKKPVPPVKKEGEGPVAGMATPQVFKAEDLATPDAAGPKSTEVAKPAPKSTEVPVKPAGPKSTEAAATPAEGAAEAAEAARSEATAPPAGEAAQPAEAARSSEAAAKTTGEAAQPAEAARSSEPAAAKPAEVTRSPEATSKPAEEAATPARAPEAAIKPAQEAAKPAEAARSEASASPAGAGTARPDEEATQAVQAPAKPAVEAAEAAKVESGALPAAEAAAGAPKAESSATPAGEAKKAESTAKPVEAEAAKAESSAPPAGEAKKAESSAEPVEGAPEAAKAESSAPPAGEAMKAEGTAKPAEEVAGAAKPEAPAQEAARPAEAAKSGEGAAKPAEEAAQASEKPGQAEEAPGAESAPKSPESATKPAGAPEEKAEEPKSEKPSEAPPPPVPGKLSPEPEPLEVLPVAAIQSVELESLAAPPSPEPVSELGPEGELSEDELLLGAPDEEGEIVLEEVEVSEDELLLGAPEEYVEQPTAPGPAPAAVTLSQYAPLGCPNGAPEHLKHLVDGFNGALKNNELFPAAYAVQSTYDFLIRYFAGVTAMCWQSASRKLPDNAKALMRNWASLGACRELLAMSLPKLTGSDGINSALLSSFKGPFADRVQKGPDIAGWIEKSLEGNQTAAGEALSVYLGEIRDFLKKCEDYFEGCEHFSEPPSNDGRLEVVVQFGEAFLELCEPDYVIQIRQCPVCLPKLASRGSAAAPPPPPVEEKVAAPELANLLFGGAPDESGDTGALLGAAAKPETLILKLGGPDPAPAKSGIFAGLSKKLKVNMPAPMAALGIEVPENIPEHLGHILNRVSYGVQHQDAQETSLSVRDALEFLVRYFAGVAGLTVRKLGKETPEIKEAWTSEAMSVSRCEQILFHSLKALASSDDSLAVLVKGTFPTGTGDAHTKTITLDVENRLKALGKFCSQTQAGWDKVRCIRENSRFLPVLKDWLAAARPFFKGVETHAEAPSDDGRMDLVVEHKEHFLEMVPPDYSLLIRRCPVCLPTYRGNDPPVPEEDAPVPSAEVPRPGTVSPAPEAAPTGQLGGPRRLDQAVEDLLSGKPAPAAEAPADASKSGEVPKPRPGLASPADEEEPAMAHDVSFIGTGKAQDGRIFHGGYINVVNVGGGTLSATVRGTHPCITVKPVRFKGKHCRIEYQIDEADLPSSRKVYVIIRSANEERQIPIWQMLPPTSTLSMTDTALRMFMAIPMMVYMFIFLLVHTQSNRMVQSILSTVLKPEELARGASYLQSVKLSPSTIGTLAGIAQFDGTIFILFAGLVPYLVALIFSKAPPDQIHRNRKWFIGFLVAPLIWVSLIVIPFFHANVNRPELKPMHFTSMYLWFLFLNGLAAYYLYISRMNELEQWIQFAFMRKVIGIVVGIVWVLCAMSAVFLR